MSRPTLRVISPPADEPLGEKFHVERNHPDPSGKHVHCRYFVLDPDHDNYAKIALLAYAGMCETNNPTLADDLREWLEALL